MKFVETARMCRLPVLLLGAVLSGCATQSSEPEPPAETNTSEVSEQALGPMQQPGILPPGPITLNPYLTAPSPDVSAAVRSEFQRAQAQMRQQRWFDARDTLQALVAAAPHLSGPWLNLGIVWLQLDKSGQARAAFERALAANPLNVDAYNQLAALERRAGHFDTADTLYGEALAVWPHSADTHCNRGILYDLYLDRWSEALAHYQSCRYLRQQATGDIDTTVNGWIIDLKRRIAQREANQ